MLIYVTQDDIDKGKRAHCQECPVALAIKRATGHEVSVDIDGFLTLYVEETHQKNIPYPDTVSTFIDSFDDGKPVKPFEFEINI